MKVLKKTGTILANAVIVLLVLIILLNVFFISSKNEQSLPSLFEYKFLVDLTDSMLPEISSGDLIIIKEQKDYLKGDIVAYRNDKKELITHRIVRIEKDKNNNKIYSLKGDNNNVEDSYIVRNKDIEGIYYKRISKVGTYLLFLKSIYGIIFLLMIIICYMTFLIIKEKFFT